MEECFLELSNINVYLPNSKTFIFKDLNLSLTNNSPIVGILGSNGSGKTLLAKVLMGLLKIKSGKIILFGENITKVKTTKRLNRLSLSFQMINTSFLRHTVKDEVFFNQKLISDRNKNLNVKERVNNNQQQERTVIIKEFLAKKEHQHPLTLSGGEKRKLSFYLLRMNNPDLYILDEPTVGLDYFGIQELKKEMQELTRNNKKIVIITHDLPFLMSLTDQVIILHKHEQTQVSSIRYQGSLTNYLLANEQEANSFLTIPIEFELYRNKILSKELANGIDYKTFLEMNSK